MRVAVSRNVLEFDTIHGPGWQCVVGSSFGCYFTHSKGSFIYFRLESLRFLIFKGAAAKQQATHTSHLLFLRLLLIEQD